MSQRATFLKPDDYEARGIQELDATGGAEGSRLEHPRLGTATPHLARDQMVDPRFTEPIITFPEDTLVGERSRRGRFAEDRQFLFSPSLTEFVCMVVG